MLETPTNDFAGNGQVSELNSFGQPWDFFGNPEDFTCGPNPITLYCTAASTNCTSVGNYSGGPARALAWATPERTSSSAAT